MPFPTHNQAQFLNSQPKDMSDHSDSSSASSSESGYCSSSTSITVPSLACEDSVAREIDTRFAPFRIGSRPLPVLPVETVPFEGQLHFQDDFEPTIHSVLQRRNVPCRHTQVCHRLNKGTLPTSGNLMLLVVSDIDTGAGYEAWKEAVLEIDVWLRLKVLDMAVEIIDHVQWRDAFWTLPMGDADDLAVEKYAMSTHHILRALKDHKWTHINLLHRGREEDKCKPTLIIEADDTEDTRWWSKTIPAIRAILAPEILEVELMFSSTMLLNGSRTENRESPSGKWPKPICLTADNCAMEGSRTGGTLCPRPC